VVVLGVERGGDVAVVVVEIGRWWWQRRSGGLSLVTWRSWVMCMLTSSPRVAQMWALTRALDGGGGSRA
jgi:hypothetical protein